MNKPTKINPHCPVADCKTDKPHADDPIVRGLIAAFAPPDQMTMWVVHAMGELRHSICRDMEENKLFAWYTRLRQPEELYIRTLYALFVADEKELHHVLSGDTPNRVSALYRKVNTLVFEGRGSLQVEQPGLKYGSFTPMEILHAGAHASFPAFMSCIGLARNPQQLPPNYREAYFKHLTAYCNYLDYMHGMFKAGKSKYDILTGLKNLHRPTPKATHDTEPERAPHPHPRKAQGKSKTALEWHPGSRCH
jgi:hypothetical protein